MSKELIYLPVNVMKYNFRMLVYNGFFPSTDK